MQTPFWLRIVLFVLITVPSALGTWRDSYRVGDVAYFLSDTAARIDRYDLNARSWLTPINLPAARGLPTAGTVDAQGIYIAYARAVYRYALDGTSEVPLMNAAVDVTALVTNVTHLFVYHYIYSSGNDLTSIAKATNTIVQSKDYFYAMIGMAMAPDGRTIFARDSGLSPSDIIRVQVNADGTMGPQTDSPHHGEYPNASKVWVFPDSGRVVDSSGTVYTADALQYVNSFGGTIDDLDFRGADVPIVLRGSELQAYTNALLPAGSRTLGYTPKDIYVNAEDVLVFTADGTQPNGIRADTIPLASLAAPQPGQPVDPRGLPFTPDSSFLDKDGILYFYSKAHQSLFRWDPAAQRYISTIALIGTPDYVTYSRDLHRVYLAYPSGLVRKLDLGVEPLSEVPFATLATANRGMVAAGRYLFAQDNSGFWATHYTFGPTGTRISSVDVRNAYPEMVWSAENQKVYYFRYSSPTDIQSAEINETGTAYPGLAPGGIGLERESPLHTDSGFTSPIRLSPDGSIVVLGSGVMHAANTLERLSTSLANSVTDIAWLNNEVRTIRTVANVAQLQQWTGPTYALGIIQQIPGTAHRLLSLPANRLLGVTLLNGEPSFYVLDAGFQVVPPSTLEAPVALAASITGANQVTLTWHDVSGEADFVVERRAGASGAWQPVGAAGTSAGTFQDSGFTPNGEYSYRVAARNGALLSPFSNEVTLLLSVPTSPQGVTATPNGGTQITVAWTDTSNESGYQVDRKTGTGGAWQQVVAPLANESRYINPGLTPGTQYFYRVRAVNALGTSSNSAEAQATTDLVPPTAPLFLNAFSSNSFSVNLSWPSTSYEDHFVIERRLGGTGTWIEIATRPADTVTYIDATTAPLTSYAYRIKAVNAVGESAYSPIANVTTPQATPPSAPTGLSARPNSETGVDIVWNNVAFETGYILQRRGDDPTSWADIATLPADTTTYRDSAVSTGVQYYYRVAAVNAGGASPYSNVDDVVPIPLLVWLEDNFDAGLGSMWSDVTGGITVDGGQGFRGSQALWFGAAGLRAATTLPIETAQGGVLEFRIRAGNSAVDGVQFWDNSETGDNVVLEYSINNGGWQSWQSLATVYPSAANWQSWVFEIPAGARSDSTRFRWRQLAHSGTRLDTWALEDVRVSAAPPPSPAAPQSLSGVVNSSTSVSLSWTPVAHAGSYLIEKLTGDTWVPVANVAAASTVYTVSNLVADTQYAFQVRTVNVAGTSEPSPVALLRTLSSWDDPQVKGSLAFANANFLATETVAGGIASLTVQRTIGRGGTVSVSYNVSAGSAIGGEDFETVSGVLTFENGEISKTITVPLLADTTMESDETFTVTLSAAGGGATLGEITTATVTLVDNDPRGALRFADATSTTGEAAGTHSIMVIRTDGAVGAVSVNFALAEGVVGDVSLAAGTLEFGDGESFKAIVVTIIDDDALERNESFVVRLENPTGGAAIGTVAEHTFTVTDDEPFTAVKAGYAGLLRKNGSELRGAAIQFKTTPSGGATGKIILGRKSCPFVAQIDAEGHFTSSLVFGKSSGAPVARLTGTIDPLRDQFSAELVLAGESLLGEGERLAIAVTDDSLLGPSTAIVRDMAADSPPVAVAAASVSGTGLVSMNGYLPNGIPFVLSTHMTVQGRIPIAFASGDGQVFGWLQTDPDTKRIRGNLGWSINDSSSEPTVRMLAFDGARYLLPTAGAPPFPMGSGASAATIAVVIDSAQSHPPLPLRFARPSSLTAAGAQGEAVSLGFKRKSGLLTGRESFANGEKWKLHGVILQGDSDEPMLVGGVATAADGRVGSWTITPPPGE